MIAYVLANWKQLAGVALAAAVIGYVAHRPAQPAIHEKLDEAASQASKAATDSTTKEAPKHRAGINFDPAPGAPAATVIVPGVGPVAVPAGERIESVEVETDEGSQTETRATSETETSAQRHLDLTITPAPRPGWQLQVGLEDVLGPRRLRLAARRRLFGPFWAEAAVEPASRTVGVAMAVEW